MTEITEAQRIALATIPPEAVEAAARAICEAENGPCKCMPDECGCIYWLAHARASISAALSAWPGMTYAKWRDYGQADRLVLPLPTENTNAET